MGEIGLAGELRKVRDLPQRIAEAARLGFAVAVVPGERRDGGVASVPRTVEGMRVIEVPDVALRAAAARAWSPTRRAQPARGSGLTCARRRGRRPRLRRRGRDRALRRRDAPARGAGTDRARHAAARRPRADPPRAHRRADRARQRPHRRVDLDRRLRPRRPVHRHRPARAGQDGRRRSSSTRSSPGSCGRGAPDARPADPLRRDRHPAPYGGPGRQADRPPGDLGVAVDADHRGVRRRDPPRARGLRPDPVPGQPGPRDARAVQAAARRGVHHPLGAGDRGPGHRARRRRGRPAAGDGDPDRAARSRTTCSSSVRTGACSPSSSRSWSPASTPSASW